LTGQGVRAEGILVTELLYITTDDQMPIGSAREIYPFEQFIEIPQQTVRTERNKPEGPETLEQKNKLQTELDCRISQLSAVMLDQDHVEIKAVIGLNLLALPPLCDSPLRYSKANPHLLQCNRPVPDASVTAPYPEAPRMYQ